MTARRHDPFPVAAPYHGIYAHGVETPAAARTLYISGQIGVAPSGDLADDFEGQCRQAIENLLAVLKAADMEAKDIVKMSFYLTRPSDMDDLVALRKEYFDGVRPAITTLFVSGLVSPDWFVEVEATACAE
ncbi:MAG: RidA family protein [Pseudomonadota bacterium]